jgi:starvation-inducible DNA-binding protein
MEELINQTQKLLATTFELYFKANVYHWNVEGRNFPQDHEFFGEFYADVYGSVDPLAEHVRQLGAYTSSTLKRFDELSDLSETPAMPADPITMYRDLLANNNIYQTKLLELYNMAERYSQIGLSNFLQARIEAHKKHEWMLKSVLKGQ